MANTNESGDLSDADLEVVEGIRQHFDAPFYLSQNPDVEQAGIDPLVHFVLWGWREGRDPNPDFSTSFYLLDNPEVSEADVNPFFHYVTVGAAEGKSARPPMQDPLPNAEHEHKATEAIRLLRPHFDAQFYLQANPDIAEAGIDPLVHYFNHGWKENRDPTPEFSTFAYLKHNSDVAAAGVQPFWHYITVGKAEGRVCSASETADLPAEAADPAEAAEPAQHLDADKIAQEVAAIRDAFDVGFYLRHNPDVAETGIDPVEHFVVSGWREGRDPALSFSVSYYLTANPDVRDLKINPFWHYIITGKDEGRLACHPGGYRAETLLHTRPLEETVKAWRSRKPPEALLTATDLCARVRAEAGAKAAMLMLSVGHDNYREVSGGVQYCIQHEEETARKRGLVYLNLHPHQPLPRLAHGSETPDVLVSLLLSGSLLGTAPMSAVTEAVSLLARDFDAVEVVVHHLMGHSPEQVADLVRATGSNRCRMWLHDFFTLCPSYVLQRNNVTFCGAPPATSNACRLCLYGEERISHRARMTDFFAALSVQVIAPSQFTADFWSERAGLVPASLTVCAHMTIDWKTRLKKKRAKSGPITIAFVGYPASHKGWPVFERIVRAQRGTPSRYRFVYFGTSQITLDGVESVHVHVTAEDPDAMIRAIAEQQVDLVLHWSTCAETFSFSTFEALAASAFVLTNPISGNVAATVRRLGLGAVLDTEADLEASLLDGRIEALVKEARQRRGRKKARVTRSDMSFSILDQEAGA